MEYFNRQPVGTARRGAARKIRAASLILIFEVRILSSASGQ
jgi:hypothetical protein